MLLWILRRLAVCRIRTAAYAGLRFEPMDLLLRFGQENREMAVESIMLLFIRTYSTD